MTTPLNPQQNPLEQQDQQDPTRALEERAPAPTPATDATTDATSDATSDATTDATAVVEDDATAVVEDDATQRVETGGPTSPATPAAAASDAPWTPPVAPGTTSPPPPVTELPRPSGPHGPAIVLGVVCLAMAGLVIAQEVGSLRVDWGDVGPLGIVAAGAMLVLFGLLGLLTSRRKQA